MQFFSFASSKTPFNNVNLKNQINRNPAYGELAENVYFIK